MWVGCRRPDRGEVSTTHLSHHQEHTVNHTQHRRLTPVLGITALVIALGALPAAARQDPGPVVPEKQASTATYVCALQRVGTQFVRCDDLTGNGVPAPGWVDER
jgi:hypothetical protein